jgi:hypothetical protein
MQASMRTRRPPKRPLRVVSRRDTLDTAKGLIRKRNQAGAGIRYQPCGGGFRVLKISGEHKPHSLKGA